MAILTPADQPAFFPSVTLTGQALLAAIAAAQAVAEGPMGSDGPVELHQETEVLTMNGGLGYLKCQPVNTDLPILMEMRGRGPISRQDGWGRSYGRQFSSATVVSAWEILSDTEYEIDPISGEIQVYAIATGSDPFDQAYPVEARISYYAGLDFSQDPLPNTALALKSALAGLLVTSQRRQQGQAYESVTLIDFYKIDYGSVQSTVDEYLTVFKAFRH